MGFRISLYQCPKKNIDKLRNFTEEDYQKDKGESFFQLLEGELIKYDTLYGIFYSYSQEIGSPTKNNLCSPILTNKLDILYDMSFYTISKEQLINIINHILKHYVNNKSNFTQHPILDLSENKWNILQNSTYEYSIFNFLHILKTFDFNKYYLVAIGS